MCSCGVDYTISGQNIYRWDGAQCSCALTGWKRHEARDERAVARTHQRPHPSCGGFACSGCIDRSADEGGWQGGPTRGFGIFGLSLVALYGASALYHLLPVSPPATARLRRLDHMTIFILIAGTYTPICVLALEGGWRTGLLALIWTLALCGVVLKLLWMDAPRWLSVGIYLAMGWLAVIAASAIFRAMPAPLEALHVHRHPSSLPQLGLRVGGPSRAAP